MEETPQQKKAREKREAIEQALRDNPPPTLAADFARELATLMPGIYDPTIERRGRPRLGVKPIRITIDKPTAKKATKIGKGNLSKGIRIAVAAFKFRRRK